MDFIDHLLQVFNKQYLDLHGWYLKPVLFEVLLVKCYIFGSTKLGFVFLNFIQIKGNNSIPNLIFS